jgi:peptide/nickel transport system substrate-binding protein
MKGEEPMKRIMMLLCVSVFLIFMVFPVLCMSQPKYGGSLTWAVDADIYHLDPHKTGSYQTMRPYCLVANNLVEIGRNHEFVPALATSWDSSADGKEWTFHLRKGVKFHNGREMTAEDIKWNFDRILDPKTGSSYKGQFDMLDSVRVVDRYTVKLIMNKPWKIFVSTLCDQMTQFWFIAPESINPDGTITRPIGTGPFEWVEYKPRDYIKYKRFKDYWEKGLPYLDEIIFKPVPDPTVRLTAIRAGDVDIAFRLPIEQAKELMKTPQKDFSFQTTGGTTVIINFNLKTPPFNDVRVRQAVAYTIKKTEFLQAVSMGHGGVLSQMFLSGSPWYCEGMPEVVQDIGKAKALMNQAGYANGLKVKALSTPAFQHLLKPLLIMQQQLKEIGMEIEMELADPPTTFGRIIKGEFQILPVGLQQFTDPDFMYRGLLHPQGALTIMTGGKEAYNNPQVTAWLEEATRISDPQKRKELYCKVEKVVHEEWPVITAFNMDDATGVRSRVKGFIDHPTGLSRYGGGGLHYTWLEK